VLFIQKKLHSSNIDQAIEVRIIFSNSTSEFPYSQLLRFQEIQNV